jgi:hypothetical protein
MRSQSARVPFALTSLARTTVGENSHSHSRL